jgi:hypothetical protein
VTAIQGNFFRYLFSKYQNVRPLDNNRLIKQRIIMLTNEMMMVAGVWMVIFWGGFVALALAVALEGKKGK